MMTSNQKLCMTCSFCFAGTQLPYSQVQDLIHNFSATVKLSSPAISPYFNYHVNGQKHQVRSLRYVSTNFTGGM